MTSGIKKTAIDRFQEQCRLAAAFLSSPTSAVEDVIVNGVDVEKRLGKTHKTVAKRKGKKPAARKAKEKAIKKAEAKKAKAAVQKP